jgi:hypothetical protein
MGQVAAVAAVGALGFAQYQQAGAAGKYNQAVQNRNAQIAEQEAAQLEKQNEFDIARFDQQFTKLQGQTQTAILKSGTTLEGSGLRVMRYNAEQAEIQKNIMTYNSKVAQSQKLEQANFARIQGSMARQQARIAQLGTLTQTGTSLLTMGGGFGRSSSAGTMYPDARILGLE